MSALKEIFSRLIFLFALLGCASPLVGAQHRFPSSLPDVCNVKDFGAKGDGVTKDTVFIQAAIDQCPKGGTVLLPAGGSFLSGTLHLKSDLRFRIEPGAKLKGSRADVDYPDLSPATVNTQLSSCRKALLYAESVQNLIIDGGELASDMSKSGVIDGGGDDNPNWNGPERTRPMAIFVVLSKKITIQALQVVNSGMWSVVNMENNDVFINAIHVDSHSGPTRDGIDIVDSTNVLIQNCRIKSEDDSICLKSGSAKGVHQVTVRDSEIQNSGVANAMKLGTASTGSFEDILFENIKIDSTKQAAMAVESVDGAKIKNVQFKNIQFKNVGTAFFVLLGQRKGSQAVGTIDNVSFENIQGETNLNWGSVVSGTTIGDKTYSIKQLRFTDVHIKNHAALTANFSTPAEYEGQYPDPRMWDAMPAFGIFFRHVDGIQYQSSSSQKAGNDVRPDIEKLDVKNFIEN